MGIVNERTIMNAPLPHYPDDADGDALARLAAAGVDMTQPLSLEFAIAAPDERSADAIAKSLSTRGYRAETYFDEGDAEAAADEEGEFGPSWSVYVSMTMVPNYDRLIRVQEELDQIARPHGGFADGWGSLV